MNEFLARDRLSRAAVMPSSIGLWVEEDRRAMAGGPAKQRSCCPVSPHGHDCDGGDGHGTTSMVERIPAAVASAPPVSAPTASAPPNTVPYRLVTRPSLSGT